MLLQIDSLAENYCLLDYAHAEVFHIKLPVEVSKMIIGRRCPFSYHRLKSGRSNDKIEYNFIEDFFKISNSRG